MTELSQNFIAGEWCAGDSSISNRNPSDLEDVIGVYAQATPTQLSSAIESAQSAQPLWAAQGLEARQKCLRAIGDELIARSEELGKLLSREEGKPLKEGIGEVYRAGQFFQYYAGEILRQIGDLTDSVRPGVEVLVHREPVGVVAVISPWNFPMATAAWKIAPALAFGNSVIWKPANLVPASAHALTEILSRQDLPSGTFNLVMGSGSVIGEALVRDPRIDAVSFTGSVEVGRQVASVAAPNFTKIQAEMGSKNALVVLDDADISTAVEAAIAGGYSGTGQKCTASSRLIVTPRIRDTFVETLTERLQAMKVGPATDPETEMGPVVSEEQLAANQAYLELGQKEGATLRCGGEKLESRTPGYYMRPALFTETRNDMRINREEMFAPIACVIPAESYEEALEITNDTDFGLTAGIVTQSLAKANHFRRHARTGCIMVNLPTAGTDYHVPFGGRGISSYGPREQGRYAVEFFTQVKTTYQRAGDI